MRESPGASRTKATTRTDGAAATEVAEATTAAGASVASGAAEVTAPGDGADVTAPDGLVRHRRGRGIWLPVAVFVALLLAGAAVGRYVIPGKGPNGGSTPPGQALTQPPAEASASTGPTLPALPTPPARPADQLAPWAQKVSTAVDIPVVAVQAYGYAQLALAQTDPSCHLRWTTLAGIGQVESKHGQVDGAVLLPGGRSEPAIIGPVLDGKSGRALVRDTDAGAFDGNPEYDRSMGPLRLLPSAWRSYAIDADADGVIDPYDLDDAALSLGRLLCSGDEDLDQAKGWNAALARYRAGTGYARSVFEAADGYGQGSRGVT
ncbi:MAG TPA: murein transglycosylase [Micromonosporaceae bacterium]